MPLQDVLSRIPGLAGYNAQTQFNQQRGSSDLAQAGGLMQLLQQAQRQQEGQRQIALREQFERARAALPEGATMQQHLDVALRAADNPKDVATIAERAQAHTANQQLALTRLNQDFGMKMSQLEVARRNATTNEQRAAIQQAQFSLSKAKAEQQAAIMTGRHLYETGMNVAIPDFSQAAVPASPQTPSTEVATSPIVPPVTMAAGEGETDAALASRFNAARQAAGIRPAVSPIAAPAAAPAKPEATLPPMPPEIASAPKKVQDQWKLRQTGIAGGGTLTPETLKFVAAQYLSGDRQAISGFARNATARIAIQNAIVDEATKRGMSPEQTAAQIADFAGTMAASRTVGQRAANISLAATEAQEMLGIVKETSDKFSRTKFVPWNMALKAYETNTGAPEIAEFGAAVNALVNVYARAINPTGQPTVSDKEHARAVLNTVQSQAQVDGVLKIINRELEIAKKAPAQVTKSLREKVTGTGTAPKTDVDALLEKYK